MTDGGRDVPLDADITKKYRFPCAGCGKKTPALDLKGVFHGTWPDNWHLDKRCPKCRGIA
jgi:hypothetical protein